MGAIMTELSTGQRPFYGYPFDSILVLDICRGLRPEFSEKTPECYIKLAKQCMDSDPNNRPSAKDISSKLSERRMIITNPSISYILLMKKSKQYRSSMYTSRLINTEEIKIAHESAKFRDSKMHDLDDSQDEIPIGSVFQIDLSNRTSWVWEFFSLEIRKEDNGEWGRFAVSDHEVTKDNPHPKE
ncbi:1713_t:CDS:2, partial [Dentiscutata heterogama]